MYLSCEDQLPFPIGINHAVVWNSIAVFIFYLIEQTFSILGRVARSDHVVKNTVKSPLRFSRAKFQS